MHWWCRQLVDRVLRKSVLSSAVMFIIANAGLFARLIPVHRCERDWPLAPGASDVSAQGICLFFIGSHSLKLAQYVLAPILAPGITSSVRCGR
jgi:hypothetical protein